MKIIESEEDVNLDLARMSKAHYRVSSDLENLEMSGNFDARRKSQGIFEKQKKSRKSQGILFCEIDFQPI